MKNFKTIILIMIALAGAPLTSHGQAGSAAGGINMTGDTGQPNRFGSGGGTGGAAGFKFGTFGRGGNGNWPTGGNSNGQAGQGGIIVVFEHF